MPFGTSAKVEYKQSHSVVITQLKNERSSTTDEISDIEEETTTIKPKEVVTTVVGNKENFYLNKDGYGYRLSLTKEDAISFVKMEKVKVNKLEEMVLVCEKDLTRKQLDDAVAIFKKANDYYFTSGFLNRKLRKLFDEK